MKTEVRMALESIEEELQKTNVCGYSAKIIRAALAESTKTSHNTVGHEIADKMEWMLLGEDTMLPLQVQLCIRDWCRQLRAGA